MRVLFGISLPDNGPFRAIRVDLLEALGMEPRGYAWTTEMVVKAHRAGARVSWVETAYRSRAGRSKISGTVRGTVGAFRGIFGTLLRLRLREVRASRRPRAVTRPHWAAGPYPDLAPDRAAVSHGTGSDHHVDAGPGS
jgi:hypothetical protein